MAVGIFVAVGFRTETIAPMSNGVGQSVVGVLVLVVVVVVVVGRVVTFAAVLVVVVPAYTIIYPQCDLRTRTREWFTDTVGG